jgi:hypothetical protein
MSELGGLEPRPMLPALALASAAVLLLSLLVLLLRHRAGGKGAAAGKAPTAGVTGKAGSEADKPRVLLLFGTQTGTAERFAKQLKTELATRYGDASAYDVMDMEDFNGPDQLPKEKVVFLLVATYGDGEPTDNAADFYNWVTRAAGEVDKGAGDAQLLKVISYSIPRRPLCGLMGDAARSTCWPAARLTPLLLCECACSGAAQPCAWLPSPESPDSRARCGESALRALAPSWALAGAGQLADPAAGCQVRRGAEGKVVACSLARTCLHAPACAAARGGAWFAERAGGRCSGVFWCRWRGRAVARHASPPRAALQRAVSAGRPPRAGRVVRRLWPGQQAVRALLRGGQADAPRARVAGRHGAGAEGRGQRRRRHRGRL